MVQRPDAAELFERHHLALYRYAYRLTRRREAAEDAVQDVFVRVLAGIGRYRSTGRDVAWLFTILRRLLIDRHRAAARQSSFQHSDADAASEPAHDISIMLAQSLEGLPTDDRDAFLLREIGGLTYEEIASVLDLTIDAVRSRIYRARLALRSALSPEANRRHE